VFFNYVLKEVLWLLRETVKCGVADRGQLILHGSWNFRASAFSCLGAKVLHGELSCGTKVPLRFVPRRESSPARKFSGTKVPHGELSRRGTKTPRRESSGFYFT